MWSRSSTVDHLAEPKHSCPHFDAAIGAIEEARTINAALRDWGDHYRGEAERLAGQCEEYEEEIDKLNSRIKDLEEELEYAQRTT